MLRVSPRRWTSGLARVRCARHALLLPVAGAFLTVTTLTRLLLLVGASGVVNWDASLLLAFVVGLLYDLAACALVLAPMAVALALLPRAYFASRLGRATAWGTYFVLAFLLAFTAIAEVVFWDEFATRFNFIAVDYLVYTTEVLDNIRESYPIGWILAVLMLFSIATTALIARSKWAHPALAASEPMGVRWRRAAAITAVSGAIGIAVDEDLVSTFANNYHRELAKNGLWSLAAAFQGNVLDYERFYPTLGTERAFARLRQELVEDGGQLLRPEAADTLRFVSNPGPELRLNVIQITVESLSAKYLGIFDPRSVLTPNLDELARRSVCFERFYATGTRTDRGMEALSSALPPTPGRSVVKRPDNSDLFTLGSVFRSRGYDTAFLYGGYGYFDNMNAYFGGNGYRVVDRGTVASEDVTFANAWGACDEDLYRWTLREADRVHAEGTPFHFFVMTTSNHRPYTYPEGRVDLPPKTSGRAGAVKYTDFAIGEFLRAASSRPWFRETLFVVVADHCAASAGKAELSVEKYHIPLLLFAPGGQIAPGRITTLTSQMDYAPTLLGFLGWSYPSRFFGHDVRRIDPLRAHALLGNYQKLGHLERGRLVVLSPRREPASYAFDVSTSVTTPAVDEREADEEAIAFYETASHMYGARTYRSLDPAAIGHWREVAASPGAPRVDQATGR